MKTRLASLFLFVTLVSCQAAGAPKPCNWYFRSGYVGTAVMPVEWLSGAWQGSQDQASAHVSLELVWMPMTAGTMLGMARTFAISNDAPKTTLSAEFFAIRKDAAGKLTYEEQAGAATPIVYDLVE